MVIFLIGAVFVSQLTLLSIAISPEVVVCISIVVATPTQIVRLGVASLSGLVRTQHTPVQTVLVNKIFQVIPDLVTVLFSCMGNAETCVHVPHSHNKPLLCFLIPLNYLCILSSSPAVVLGCSTVSTGSSIDPIVCLPVSRCCWFSSLSTGLG